MIAEHTVHAHGQDYQVLIVNLGLTLVASRILRGAWIPVYTAGTIALCDCSSWSVAHPCVHVDATMVAHYGSATAGRGEEFA